MSGAAGFDRLIADFNDHPGLPQTIFRIGEEYYNKASQKKNEGLKAESENCLQNAITVWGKIIPLESHTIYPAHAYYFSATCYRRLGQHEKAINYYQAVVDKWPKYEYAWLALLRTVHTYEYLKTSGAMPEAEANGKIQSVYERILAEYPESSAANETHRWFSSLDRRLNSRTNEGERE